MLDGSGKVRLIRHHVHGAPFPRWTIEKRIERPPHDRFEPHFLQYLLQSFEVVSIFMFLALPESEIQQMHTSCPPGPSWVFTKKTPIDLFLDTVVFRIAACIGVYREFKIRNAQVETPSRC